MATSSGSGKVRCIEDEEEDAELDDGVGDKLSRTLLSGLLRDIAVRISSFDDKEESNVQCQKMVVYRKFWIL
jgi:hypothetical protein